MRFYYWLAGDGKYSIHYEERLGTGGQGFTASPVAAGDKLYFTGEQGDVFVSGYQSLTRA